MHLYTTFTGSRLYQAFSPGTKALSERLKGFRRNSAAIVWIGISVSLAFFAKETTSSEALSQWLKKSRPEKAVLLKTLEPLGYKESVNLELLTKELDQLRPQGPSSFWISTDKRLIFISGDDTENSDILLERRLWAESKAPPAWTKAGIGLGGFSAALSILLKEEKLPQKRIPEAKSVMLDPRAIQY